jgi:hypothetical protein
MDGFVIISLGVISMKLFKYWKSILLLTGIFLLGVTTGVLFTLGAVKKSVQIVNSPDGLTAQIMKNLNKALNLTPNQIENIKPYARVAAIEAQMQQKDHFMKINQIAYEAEDKILHLLTEEQKAAMQKRREKRHKDFQELLSPPKK